MLGFSAAALRIGTILRIEENESLVLRLPGQKDRRTEGQTSRNPERL
jgi:hypothetical protein